MKKDLGRIVIGALLIGVCLSIVLCIASFAKLSRIERDVRLAEGRLRVEEVKTSPSLPECGGAVGTDIEIARLALHAAYKVESDDFYASHKNMGGGNYSYAMLYAAKREFDGQWRKVATNWFYSTARNDFERKLMKEYDVDVADLKYTRDELRQIMAAWKSVRSGKGVFAGQSLCFTNGVALYTDKKYDCQMELRLLKTWIWVYEGNVYIFGMSDVAGNDGYGASDSLCENWLFRFKGGKIVDCCHFKHGCNAFKGLRFQFKPEANSLLANSLKTGDIYGEFTIGLVEHTDSKGIKSRPFRYEGSQAE
jgi:hypothetical protein